jgi:hypothetical protein
MQALHSWSSSVVMPSASVPNTTANLSTPPLPRRLRSRPGRPSGGMIVRTVFELRCLPHVPTTWGRGRELQRITIIFREAEVGVSYHSTVSDRVFECRIGLGAEKNFLRANREFARLAGVGVADGVDQAKLIRAQTLHHFRHTIVLQMSEYEGT